MNNYRFGVTEDWREVHGGWGQKTKEMGKADVAIILVGSVILLEVLNFMFDLGMR